MGAVERHVERGDRLRALQMLQYVGLDDGDEVTAQLQSLVGRLQPRPAGRSGSPVPSPFASPARRAAMQSPSRGSPDAALVEGLLATGSRDVLRAFERWQDEAWGVVLGRGGSLQGLLRRAAQAGEPLSPGDAVAVHASRVSHEHFFEAAVEAALAEVVDGRLEVAKTLLRPSPQLQPLVAVLAWDAVASAPTGAVSKADVLPARKRVLQVLGESAAVQLGASEQIMLHTCRDLAFSLHVAERLSVPSSDFLQATDEELRSSSRLVRALGKGSVLRALAEELPDLDSKLVADIVAERPAQPGTSDELWREHDVDMAHVWAVLRLSISELIHLGVYPGNGNGDPGQFEARLARPRGALGDQGDLRLQIMSISCPFLRCYAMNVLVAFLSIDWGTEAGGGEEESGAGTGGEASALEVLGGFLRAIKEGLPRSVDSPSRATVAGLHDKMACSGCGLPPDVAAKALSEVMRTLKKSASTFVTEAEWRAGVMRSLQERSKQPGSWRWDKVMAALHCTGQMFLSLCQQHVSDPELCDAVIAHFNLTDAETASYQVSEWMQDWVSRSSVEDMISHISSEKTSEAPTSSYEPQSSEGGDTTVTATASECGGGAEEDLNTPARTVSLELFNNLKLGPVDKAMLCIDIASAAAGTPDSSRALVAKAEEFLLHAPISEAETAATAATSDAYLISQSRHMIGYLRSLLDSRGESGKSFRRSFVGVKPGSSTACALAADLPASHLKALNTLEEAINAAAAGKRQFLSGLLHNLARVLGEGDSTSRGGESEEPFWAGLQRIGFGPPVAMSPPVPGPWAGGDARKEESGGEAGAGSRREKAEMRGAPGLSKDEGPCDGDSGQKYISQFISYLVKLGDILSIVDSAETLNYFSVLDRTPRAILLRTIFDRNQPEMASQVAQLLGTDLVHEVLSACVTPVGPPLRRAQGHEASAIPWEGFRGQSLKMDVLRYLAERSPVRVALACVYVLMQEERPAFSSTSAAPSLASSSTPSDGGSHHEDREALAFALELAGPFPPLKQWVKLQAGILALSSSGEGGTGVVEDDSAGGFLWEDSGPYLVRVRQLAAEGKHTEAMALADRWLPGGVPDWVLHEAAALELREALACEIPSEQATLWTSLCAKILRVRSTETVAKFVMECADHLPPGPGLPVLRRCLEDLGPGRAREEAAKLCGRLELFEEILSVDPRFNGDPIPLSRAYAADPAQLASSLAASGHHNTALKVCRACGVPDEVWAQVQGSRLSSHLLEGKVGGGAAAAVQFVRRLDPRRVLQVAEAAMRELASAGHGASPEATLVLVEFLLAEYGPGGQGPAEMSPRQQAFLQRSRTGLRGLAPLSAQWQARCRHLSRAPDLLAETLLMNHQVHLVEAVRRGAASPGLCSDATVAMYAERALARARGADYPAGLGYRAGPFEAPSLRRARAANEGGSSAVFRSFDLDVEEVGGQGALDLDGKTPALFILTGDPAADMEVRAAHFYSSAPSAVLFQSIMSLASSPVVAAQVSTSILKNAAENLLSPGTAAPPSGAKVDFSTVSAASELLDALDTTDALLPRLSKAGEDAVREEAGITGPKDAGLAEAGRGAPPGALPGAIQQCRERLSVLRADVEMVLTLLSADVPVEFKELQAREGLERLLDRLLEGEHYNLAIFVCTRYAISPARVWLLWGCELIRAGMFADARLRIARAAAAAAAGDSSPSISGVRRGWAAGAAGWQDLPRKSLADAALEALEGCGSAPEPPELQDLASQIERMALSRRSGALSADTFLSLLSPGGKRQAKAPARAGWRRGRNGSPGGDGPASAAMGVRGDASAAAARDLEKAEEAKYYLSEYDPGRLVAYLFRNGRPREAFEELTGQTEAPLARAIVVSAVEAEQGPALVSFLKQALTRSPPARLLTEGALRGALEALQDTGSLEELFSTQILFPGLLCRAGETCVELIAACRPTVATRHLQALQDACEEFLNRDDDEGKDAEGEALVAGQEGEAVPRSSAAQFFPASDVQTHEVLRLKREAGLQLDVLRALPGKLLESEPASAAARESPQVWNILTTGPDLEERRVLATAELSPHNFDVAFCVLQEFRLEMRLVALRAVRTLLADPTLSRGGFEARLTYLMRNVRATSTSTVFDEAALAALQMLSEQPSGRVPNTAGKWLVKQLSCAHSQTIGWLALGKISRALESAVDGGTLADLRLVEANARMHSDLQTLRKCTEAIEQHQDA